MCLKENPPNKVKLNELFIPIHAKESLASRIVRLVEFHAKSRF